MHSSQQGTRDTLSTVPSRNSRHTGHSFQQEQEAHCAQFPVGTGTHWVQLQSGTVGTHWAHAQFPIETRNRLGTVPSRNRRCSGYSSQQEQEFLLLQNLSRNKVYMGLSSQQEQGTSGEHMMTIVTRKNMEHMGRISSLKINLIS